MKSLTFSNMRFKLSESGVDTEYRLNTGSLCGYVKNFTLIKNANSDSSPIVSDVFFEDKDAREEFFEKKTSSKLGNFVRSIDAVLDLTKGENATPNALIKVIGNSTFRTATVGIEFIEISDEQFAIWENAISLNELNQSEWDSPSNKFPNTGHCSLQYFVMDDFKGVYCTLISYIPTRIFNDLWLAIEERKIDKFYACFRLLAFTDKSAYEGSSSGVNVFYLPPAKSYSNEDGPFDFTSSAMVGGSLTDIQFSMPITKD